MNARASELDRLKRSKLPDAVGFQFSTASVLDLEATFSAPDFYTKPRVEISDLETQWKIARGKAAHLYARWHELDLLQRIPPP